MALYENQIDVVQAMALFEYLKRFVDWRYLRLGTTGVVVAPTVVQTPRRKTRYIRRRTRIPDLMVLTERGAQQLCEDNYKVRLEHDNPRLIVDFVREKCSGESYIDKKLQYQGRGVGEYWVVDRYEKQVVIFTLEDTTYTEATYKEDDWLVSTVFPELNITALALLPLEEYS